MDKLLPQPEQAPLPMGVALFKPPARQVCADVIDTLARLLREAQAGQVTGLALVVLHADGRFDLQLRGDATREANQMGVAGMLAALQKMALELTY